MGVLMSRCPRSAWNGSDVVAILEEMRRERVAQRVRCGVFRDPGAQDGHLHGALEHRFVQVVPAPLARVAIDVEPCRGEHPLPPPLAASIGILTAERSRHVDPPGPRWRSR